jgi:ABC-type transport system involved in cytochrome c biogenesis permease subunit
MAERSAGKYVLAVLVALLLLVLVGCVMLLAAAVGYPAWGDLFSLGQFCLDAVLLPVAVLGFVYATEEFRRAQQLPDLDLYWGTGPEAEAKELTLKLPSQAMGHKLSV